MLARGIVSARRRTAVGRLSCAGPVSVLCLDGEALDSQIVTDRHTEGVSHGVLMLQQVLTSVPLSESENLCCGTLKAACDRSYEVALLLFEQERTVGL
ncbi:hypothetical protein P4O66_006162 [Electrophorus voltai]|uniref:Uncharacterized protein n=1 Tax=Electrophorus voltai TaxID=2609070 RepID=A0AAD8ZIK8_9TELE|nr:hypothetical protein P4O66_006162 [Electrophorus voltai]